MAANNNNIHRLHRFPSLLMLLLCLISSFHLQVIAADHPLSKLKLNSRILQDSIIKRVNQDPNAGWKAALNPRLSNYTVGEFKYLLGVKPTPQKFLQDVPVVTHDKSFKGHCGSCWAFGAVESLSDRFCIHFGKNMSLSVNDLLACCGFSCGSGCDGGYPISAWRYFVSRGVVTEECDPYFDDTGCSHPGCEPAFPTPKCSKKCVNGNQVWQQSKHYSVGAYRVNSDPHDIMAEVYKNGPVEVSFTVYEDFAHYKSGIYKHVTGDVMGGHAVKLIGWGTSDAGEDYWLIANQWNKGWGEDGYFKIVRGKNECEIEDDVTAGLPSTKNLVREVNTIGGLEYASA
ncbi:hypothetical protein ACFE04_016927 [Oxalis oulophora]